MLTNNERQAIIDLAYKEAGAAELLKAHTLGITERTAQRKNILSAWGSGTGMDAAEKAHQATINPAMNSAKALGVPFENMGTHLMNRNGGTNYSPGYFRANTRPKKAGLLDKEAAARWKTAPVEGIADTMRVLKSTQKQLPFLQRTGNRLQMFNEGKKMPSWDNPAEKKVFDNVLDSRIARTNSNFR